MSWKTEFPDYDGIFICPDGWKDNSWHNDTCPHIEKRIDDIVIYVWQDYVDENQRESFGKRYLFKIEADDYDVFAYETDDWNEIKNLMKGVML